MLYLHLEFPLPPLPTQPPTHAFCILIFKLSSLPFLVPSFDNFDNASLSMVPHPTHALCNIQIVVSALPGILHQKAAKPARHQCIRKGPKLRIWSAYGPNWWIGPFLGLVLWICKPKIEAWSKTRWTGFVRIIIHKNLLSPLSPDTTLQARHRYSM